MDDIKWYMDKLLQYPDKSEEPYKDLITKRYLQQLSVLELVYLRDLMISEIISRRRIDGMTSLNHDDEKERFL